MTSLVHTMQCSVVFLYGGLMCYSLNFVSWRNIVHAVALPNPYRCATKDRSSTGVKLAGSDLTKGPPGKILVRLDETDDRNLLDPI